MICAMKGSDSVKNKRMTKKAGFSLIELIIVIAIMAIFVGIATLSIGLIRSADTRGLASAINDSLTDLKSYTESHKGPYHMFIYKIDDSGFYSHFQEGEVFSYPESSPNEGDKRLGMATLRVDFVDGTDGSTKTIGDGSGTSKVYAKFRIQKKDGSYLDAPKSLSVFKGSTCDFKVLLTKDTGLHYVEQQ